MPQKQDINDLLPLGLVASRKWLLKQGLNAHTLDNWVKSKKLLPVTQGLYTRPGIPLTWQAIVLSLNRMSKTHTYVGGLTALELAGLGHYVKKTTQTIHLYSLEPRPSWLNKLNLTTKFCWHNSKKLWPETALTSVEIFKVQLWREDLPNLLLASPEQAYLETLADVPLQVSFEHADALMQGLFTLSPTKLDTLLKTCNSIKVKRLFLWFAQRHDHPWLNKLVVGDYNLGSGKRMIAKDGKLDNKFLITVPRQFHGSG